MKGGRISGYFGTEYMTQNKQKKCYTILKTKNWPIK